MFASPNRLRLSLARVGPIRRGRGRWEAGMRPCADLYMNGKRHLQHGMKLSIINYSVINNKPREENEKDEHLACTARGVLFLIANEGGFSL
jgi:hypothetical protein